MSRLSKKQLEVTRVFCPNENGVSRWVTRETLDANEILNWGKNGTGRHGIYCGDNRYIWEKQPIMGQITALRTVGLSEDVLYGHTRPIRKDINEFHKLMGCVVCGSNSDLVCDHKNDLYNDPRVLNTVTQTRDDLQCLCNHCNLVKRQVSKKTKETMRRFGATGIPSIAVFGVDFTSGDESFDLNDINAMVGTYWHDPVAFMTALKK